jgi:hypothetical protein
LAGGNPRRDGWIEPAVSSSVAKCRRRLPVPQHVWPGTDRPWMSAGVRCWRWRLLPFDTRPSYIAGVTDYAGFRGLRSTSTISFGCRSRPCFARCAGPGDLCAVTSMAGRLTGCLDSKSGPRFRLPSTGLYHGCQRTSGSGHASCGRLAGLCARRLVASGNDAVRGRVDGPAPSRAKFQLWRADCQPGR